MLGTTSTVSQNSVFNPATGISIVGPENDVSGNFISAATTQAISGGVAADYCKISDNMMTTGQIGITALGDNTFYMPGIFSIAPESPEKFAQKWQYAQFHAYL